MMKFGGSMQPASPMRRPMSQAALPTAGQASEIANLKGENVRSLSIGGLFSGGPWPKVS